MKKRQQKERRFSRLDQTHEKEKTKTKQGKATWSISAHYTFWDPELTAPFAHMV